MMARRVGRKPTADFYVPPVPDDLSRPSVEARLLRACKTIRAMPDREARFLNPDSQPVWREALKEWGEYGSEEVRIRFVPKPHDVSDCLTALAWCRSLSKRAFRLIWWRSFDNVSFALIAARIGRSDETARRWYQDAIEAAWSRALEEHFATPEDRRVGDKIPIRAA